MLPWTFYPAFLATFLSITCLTYIAWHQHDTSSPRTLSEIGASSSKLLVNFRVVLVLCGTLFAVTMFFFIIPRVNHGLLQLLAWVLYYGDELLLAAVPARGTRELLWHNVFAYAMAAGMLTTALLFIINLHGTASWIELVITGLMVVVGLSTFGNRSRYIFYELMFIYLSHISILVAALALR